jgi:hypothetical protein
MPRRNRYGPRDVSQASRPKLEHAVNNIIWLVGAIVIILAILSFFGLR